MPIVNDTKSSTPQYHSELQSSDSCPSRGESTSFLFYITFCKTNIALPLLTLLFMASVNYLFLCVSKYRWRPTTDFSLGNQIHLQFKKKKFDVFFSFTQR